MSDSWLQRLVVRGPTVDVRVFQRAAASRRAPEYVTVEPACRTQRLSFEKLCALLPAARARRFATDVEEPWDLVVDRPRRLPDGSREVTYRFQLSAFEPEALVVEVSRLYPRLGFVIGCVAPSADEQSSLFVHAGRTRRWRLPDSRKDAIWDQVPEETEDNEDEVTGALAEADWQMMDEVVAHWQEPMDALMARAPGKHRPGHDHRGTGGRSRRGPATPARAAAARSRRGRRRRGG